VTATPARPEARSALDVLREQIAPDASDAELEYLAQVAARYQLDAIAGQVVLYPRYDRRLGRKVHRPIVTAEGRHVIAERTGELEGIDGPQWCGPRNPDGTHTWLDVWDYDEAPHAARVFVHRRGRLPFNGTVRWAEFAQYDGSGNLTPTWRQMPSHMLGKTALSLGLRRAFPGLIPEGLDVVIEAEFTDDSAAGDVAREGPVMQTPAQRDRIRDLMRARGYGGNSAADRARRLTLMRQAIDDPQLAKPDDLTTTEASQVIDYLEGLRPPTRSGGAADDAPAAAEPPDQDPPPDPDEEQQGLPL
jgi:hypothetical protein